MKPLNRLARLKPSLFKLSYSPTYTSFLPNHIAINASHPLHIAQRRLRNEQRKEGLWWHATNGTDTSKSSCVRHWARRRLMQAFVEELRERGYDESGKLVDVGKLQDGYVQTIVKLGRRVDLTGSLRMHGVPLLVPAKYGKVKEEVKGIVDALVQSAVDAALELKGEDLKKAPGSRRSQTQRPQNQRSAAVPAKGGTTKKTTAAEREPLRMKPTASPGLPFRIKSASSAAPRIKPKAPVKDAPRIRKSSTMSLGEDFCV